MPVGCLSSRHVESTLYLDASNTNSNQVKEWLVANNNIRSRRYYSDLVVNTNNWNKWEEWPLVTYTYSKNQALSAEIGLDTKSTNTKHLKWM